MSDLPAWMSGKSKKKKQNSRSAKHEKTLANKVGGKVQTGSGNTWKAPNDVRSDEHLIEHKYTDRGSFSLNASYLRRLVDNARRSGREAAIVIDFEHEGIRVTATVERTI